MLTIAAIIEMSRSEHARLRALHGAQFPALIEPWLGLLEMRALARGHGQDISLVVIALAGEAQAMGMMDRPHTGWILAALEERCEQERLGTTLLYEAQDGGSATSTLAPPLQASPREAVGE